MQLSGQWVKEDLHGDWRLIIVVREIRLLAEGMEVSFNKIGRTANGVANYFAKLGVSDLFSGVFLFSN